MSDKKSGSRTLLLSVLMSAPGPIVMGLGLLTGRSSTQIADFVRRSAELLGIIASFAVYQLTSGENEKGKRERLERLSNAFVGAMMCLGGSIMILLTLTSGQEDKGNVIPALVISLLGVIANSAFWWKYARLCRQQNNTILQVQSRLYRAKSLVDCCVTAALLSVTVAPGSMISGLLDFAGSLIVAAYLVWCGIRTILEAVGNRKKK